MHRLIKRAIAQAIFIIAFFSFLYLLYSTTLSPIEGIMDGGTINGSQAKQIEQDARGLQDHAANLLVKGPAIILIIIAIILIGTLGWTKWRTQVFERAVADLASHYSLTITKDHLFSYPVATGHDEESTLIIEAHRHPDKEHYTHIHLGTDHYLPNVTIMKKGLLNSISGKHLKIDRALAKTHVLIGDKETAEQAITPITEKGIHESKGTWYLQANEIRYEEPGLITNPEYLRRIITTAKALRDCLAP